MKRKLIIGMLALTMALNLAACSKPSDENTNTKEEVTNVSELEKAKKNIDEFVKHVQNVDMPQANEYLVDEAKIKNAKKVEEDEMPPSAKIFINIIKEMDYKYYSGEIEDQATEAILTYQFEGKDMEDLMAQLFAESLKGMTEEDLLKSVKMEDVANTSYTVDFNMKKVEDDWKITNPQEILSKILNTSAMINEPATEQENSDNN